MSTSVPRHAAPARPPIPTPPPRLGSAALIGATLGQRYELLRILGQGGMGCVYAAVDRDTGAHVAVKVLHRHLLEAPEGEGPHRFRREAEAARGIPGDHVVRVLDAGTDEPTGHLYLVTEYLDGEDLQQLLDRTGPLAPAAALLIAFQALTGLAAAHAAGVVHRDVKPANIFLARCPGGTITVKLLDFGIAKIRPDPFSLPHAALTTTGGILGSPLYMSPEQVQSSRDVDHRADLWSLGSVLYAALAGRAPHQHLASLGQLLVAVCIAPPPPLAEVAPWVHPAIAGAVHRALQIPADDRYASAAAMLDALRPLVPSGALTGEMLVPSGESARPVRVSSLPPSPALRTPRVVVAFAPAPAIRGDEVTEQRIRLLPGAETLASRDREAPAAARSGVPSVGGMAGARTVTVDPRRLLGAESELWTFSLDVHRDVSSLVARIWRSLSRAGAKVPARTYGTTWALVEPRTGRAIVEPGGEGVDKRTTLEEAGIRTGTVLWVVPLDAGIPEP
jgi:eukaryotic-like serine/threonine-protein kinase